MIYDNANGGYQVIEKFLPPGKGGNILITSRNFEVCRITEESRVSKSSCINHKKTATGLDQGVVATGPVVLVA
jgi:hypothetical protein